VELEAGGGRREDGRSQEAGRAVRTAGTAQGKPRRGSSAWQPIPAWLISMAVHALGLFLFSLTVYVTQVEEVPISPLQATIPETPQVRLHTSVEHSSTKDLVIEMPIDEVRPSAVSALDIVVDEELTDESDAQQMRGGREVAVSDSEMGGSGAFTAIGAGGGDAGMFGNRGGGNRQRALMRYGGTKASDEAVENALRWFHKHQSADGGWDVDGYKDRCKDSRRCEPGAWFNDDSGDLACTAYALLCFLGAGHDHKHPCKYHLTVKDGLEYLLSKQQSDGSFGKGSNNYVLAIVTMALAEAYGMSHDLALKPMAQRAVDRLIANQGRTSKYPYGVGWDYTKANPTRNDSSITGWGVMALKSAVGAGLDVHGATAGADDWLVNTWRANNKNHHKLAAGDKAIAAFPYTWNAISNATMTGNVESGSGNIVCVGSACAAFLHHGPGDVIFDSLCNATLRDDLPDAWPVNTYYVYYGTMALFHAQDERWKKWNGRVRDLLVDAQRKAPECYEGSWDFAGTKFYGSQVGRLLSTAYCCLSLQVYYRYRPIHLGAPSTSSGL
jgi:hypothetical protein